MRLMQHWNRQWRILTAALVSVLLLVACGGGADTATEDDGATASGTEAAGAAEEAGGTIKVGLLVPQSGVYAQLGTDMQRAWDLWLEQNDNKFGNFDVETVVADEGESPDTGVPALQSLVQRDNVDVVVGVVNSAVALGGADIVTEAGKLFLISNAGANALTGSGGHELIWRTSYTNSQRGFASGEYVATLDDVKDSVFVVAADYAAGHEDIAGFRKALEDGGGKIIGEAYSPFGSTDDFQPYLSQIKQSGAKAVYAFYAGAETIAFIKQYESFGLKGEIPLYGAGVITEAVLPALGKSAEGINTVWHYSSQLDNPANQAFVEAYGEKYEGALPTVFSTQTWDAAIVLDKALEAAGDVSGEALAAALEGIGPIEDSPRGTWEFEGRNPKHPIYLREVQEQDGQFVNAVLEELGTYAQPDVETP